MYDEGRDGLEERIGDVVEIIVYVFNQYQNGKQHGNGSKV